jgi:hypothetical protein
MHYVILSHNSRSDLTNKKHKAMKTSLLISSFAAFCLLLTFAEAPRRHGEDKMNVASTDNISIATVKMLTMLPGVVITADRKKETVVSVPVIPTEDFTYLKFDVTEYWEVYGNRIDESEVLPESMEADYGYLKFKISDYITDSGLSGGEITELPVSENTTSDISTPEPAVSEFEYLRFDVINYISNSGTEAAEIGELPSEEAKTGTQAETILPGNITIEFGYLKFDVTKYYNPDHLVTDEQFELPEE